MDPYPHHHQPVSAGHRPGDNNYVAVDRLHDDAPQPDRESEALFPPPPRSPSFKSAGGDSEDNDEAEAKSAEEEDEDEAKVLAEAENDALKVEVSELRALMMEREVQFVLRIYEADFVKEVYKGKMRDVESEMQQLGIWLQERESQFENQIKESHNEIELLNKRIEGMESDGLEKVKILEQNYESVGAVKQSLVRVIERLDDAQEGSHDVGRVVEEVGEREVVEIVNLARAVERKVGEYQEMRKRERKQLESSVVSLTEENRDINTLLRIALVEKENVEKKLKGTSEQKRVPLLQLGLHKVGFSFMMGSGQSEASAETCSVSNESSKSDGSEEEVVSLASVVEKIMRNLRDEISQLRRSLDDTRSDNERLQSLSEKQGQIIVENELYIKQLEDREQDLSHNIEELLIEMRETEEEVARWREACELEVEAGKNAVGERDKMALILQQELKKTKAALEISNNKLKLKEELANAAMAAQAAAEKSLQLADSRASGLCQRIEELTRQLEETDNKQGNSHRVRHICWPWLALKLNPAATTNNRGRYVNRVLPEMRALLSE